MCWTRFVSANGGVLTINFDGGGEVLFLTDDFFRIQNSGSLNYGLNIQSTGDIVMSAGSLDVSGDLTLEVTAEPLGEIHPSIPTQMVAMPSAKIDLSGGTLSAADISIEATARVDLTIASNNLLDGAISIGAAVATSVVGITIDGSTNIVASGNLTISATSDVKTTVTRAPDDDGDAGDDDRTQDAAIAASIVSSDADVEIGGSAHLTAGGAADIRATNLINVTTAADGQIGNSDAGGTVATTVLHGTTNVLLAVAPTSRRRRYRSRR